MVQNRKKRVQWWLRLFWGPIPWITFQDFIVSVFWTVILYLFHVFQVLSIFTPEKFLHGLTHRKNLYNYTQILETFNVQFSWHIDLSQWSPLKTDHFHSYFTEVSCQLTIVLIWATYPYYTLKLFTAKDCSGNSLLDYYSKRKN